MTAIPGSATRKVEVVEDARYIGREGERGHYQVQVTYTHRVRYDNTNEVLEWTTAAYVIAQGLSKRAAETMRATLSNALDDAFAQGMSHERHIQGLGKP